MKVPYAVACSLAFPFLTRAQTVNLGTAATFGVLGATTVTNTGPTVILGDIGVSPGTATTGFGGPPQGSFSGTLHSKDAVAGQAQSDALKAYTFAAGIASTKVLTGTDLGGLTLVPGVYFFSSSAQLTGVLTLDAQGDTGALFIFQIGTTLITAPNSAVRLINGVQACNVIWQVGSSATLDTGTDFIGIVLASMSIGANTGASISGSLIALNGAVTLQSNTVRVVNTCSTTSPSTTPSTTSPSTTLSTTSPSTTLSTTSPSTTLSTTSPSTTPSTTSLSTTPSTTSPSTTPSTTSLSTTPSTTSPSTTLSTNSLSTTPSTTSPSITLSTTSLSTTSSTAFSSTTLSTTSPSITTSINYSSTKLSTSSTTVPSTAALGSSPTCFSLSTFGDYNIVSSSTSTRAQYATLASAWKSTRTSWVSITSTPNATNDKSPRPSITLLTTITTTTCATLTESYYERSCDCYKSHLITTTDTYTTSVPCSTVAVTPTSPWWQEGAVPIVSVPTTKIDTAAVPDLTQVVVSTSTWSKEVAVPIASVSIVSVTIIEQQASTSFISMISSTSQRTASSQSQNGAPGSTESSSASSPTMSGLFTGAGNRLLVGGKIMAIFVVSMVLLWI